MKKTILAILMMACVCFAGRNDFITVKNSFGYDSIAIFDDSVLIDSSGAGDYNKKVLSDTSEWITVRDAYKG